MQSVTIKAGQFIALALLANTGSVVVNTVITQQANNGEAAVNALTAELDSLKTEMRRVPDLVTDAIVIPDHTTTLLDLQASVALVPVDLLPCPQCPDPPIIPEPFDYLPVLESIGGTVYKLADRIRSLEMAVAKPDTLHCTLTGDGDEVRFHIESHAARWELR